VYIYIYIYIYICKDTYTRTLSITGTHAQEGMYASEYVTSYIQIQENVYVCMYMDAPVHEPMFYYTHTFI